MSNSDLAETVGVVITTYNQAHYLAEAIASVFGQSRPAAEIIVVDDGSTDDPRSVIEAFDGIQYFRQENAGPSAARNTGLRAATSRYVIFLDADDRLLPPAIEAGLADFVEHPNAGFVYGSHRRIDKSGDLISKDIYTPVGDNAYASFLYFNAVGMHATVLYDRQKALAAGGFDPSFKRSEDYEMFLRMSRLYPIHSYAEPVAEYRWHNTNISNDKVSMLRWSQKALSAQSAFVAGNPALEAAQAEGLKVWTKYYARSILDDADAESDILERVRKAALAWKVSPLAGFKRSLRPVVKAVYQLMPYRVKAPILSHYGIHRPPPVGKVNFGDLSANRPLSRDFGYNRGTPVDRGYIEDFLERNKALVQGRVLEIGDDSYSRRFGEDRITQQDILHVHAGNPIATIIGDMSEPGVLPDGAFDCLVLTQTLHLIYDMPNAIERIHAALKPGGVALITVPGITPIDHGEWKNTWYWSLTRYSLARLLETRFGTGNIRITTYGNVYTATGFIQGAALEELDPGKIEMKDEAYTIVVAAVARRAPE